MSADFGVRGDFGDILPKGRVNVVGHSLELSFGIREFVE